MFVCHLSPPPLPTLLSITFFSLFPILFHFSTLGILGLTVLAIGNSVGDWVADTAVARAGKPGMGISSCFGSPLLNDVIGLSVALIVSQGFNTFTTTTVSVSTPFGVY